MPAGNADGQTRNPAFGAPGAEPRWTQSTKEGIGTAYHTSCRLWFTLSHGIIDEIYYPHVDQPNTRDLQLLITDGETFCHEERRDLDHAIDYPEKGTLLYRLTNSDRAGRYRVVKEIIADPHSSVLLIQTRLEISDEALRGKLRVFVLLAPHLRRGGAHNSAEVFESGGRALFHVHRSDNDRDDLHLMLGSLPDFTRRSVGYVGASDGWQDLQDFKMDWDFTEANDGNVALTGEIDLTQGLEFTTAVAFGRSRQGAAAKLLQSLAIPFSKHREVFLKQWQRTSEEQDYAKQTGDGGSLFRLSRCILLAHEDKTFSGGLVASMSIPWGETKGDDELGGYHLVWPRDLMQSATGLLAAGQHETPRRALIWLACIQDPDGKMPQNSWIDGRAFWKGMQLDEVAAPILLAWRLREAKALGDFDPWVLVSRAAGYLIAHGPVTMQERWEECSGYSPATLAAIIGGMICVAEFARERGCEADAEFALTYADWLSAHLEDWTVTTCGELVPGKPRHYLRIAPGSPDPQNAQAQPDTAMLRIANGGGEYPARNIVSLEFLQLVRLGLRDPLDPLIVDSVAVIDAVLKHDLPPGPCWRRYNHDGYGQKEDGSAFDGAGTGGCWPLLTGERGHYELDAGRDPRPLIKAMERFSNTGGMLPEQLWWNDDLPHLKRGEPTGSAMPLCWAHAEYLTLVRSAADGIPFERIAPAYERYVRHRAASTHEMWSCAHRLATIPAGKTLRILTVGPAVIHWRVSENFSGDATAQKTGLGCWFADVPSAELPAGSEIHFRLICGDHQDEAHRITVAGNSNSSS